MIKIAFVTTCKGRLHHLQETLPRLRAAGADEVVVVDYGCPDGTGAWVRQHHPGVRLVTVDDDPGFCVSRARNLGAAATDADWICFIDADIRVMPEWLDWLRANLQSDTFYRAAKVQGVRQKETWGTFVCQKKAFQRIGGYDEAFRGWGGEDDDLYFRLTIAAAQAESEYPAHFVAAISHDDAERTKFHEVKNKQLQVQINRYYRKAKYFLMESQGTEPPIAVRQQLMDQISAAVRRAFERRRFRRASEFRPRVRLFLDGLSGRKRQVLEIGYRRRYILFGPSQLRVDGWVVGD